MFIKIQSHFHFHYHCKFLVAAQLEVVEELLTGAADGGRPHVRAATETLLQLLVHCQRHGHGQLVVSLCVSEGEEERKERRETRREKRRKKGNGERRD